MNWDNAVARLNKLSNWQVALLFSVVGFLVFFNGLNNPFQGDDINQIVNSVPVHSLTHLSVLFEGGTFYNGQAMSPLAGNFYRPLMTTMFAVIYTFFGPHPFYFHFLQLIICIATAFVLYLFFAYSFGKALSLLLAALFLVHPLNSQVVYAIPSLQDALFVFFGVLALWLLMRFQSARSLIAVALALLLSLLSKEAGGLFVAIVLLYLFWFDKKRLYPFMSIIVIPIILYLTLKINAVGFARHSSLAPIDSLGFVGRLMTVPSIVLFYISKFFIPWKLASAYYWVYPTFGFQHVLLPLLIDLFFVGVLFYVGYKIRRQGSEAQFFTYVFFGMWSAAGLIAYSQIFPIDMTACETWFYFSMVGVMGMIGGALITFQPQLNAKWLLLAATFVITIFGIRSGLRGMDWRSEYILATHDIVASKEDYNAANNIAKHLINEGSYTAAEPYVERSISVYPTYINYYNLGVIRTNTGDFTGAFQAYNESINYGMFDKTYEGLAALTLVFPKTNAPQYYSLVLRDFPQDPTLWQYWALYEYQHGNADVAKAAIEKAASYSQVQPHIYEALMNNEPLHITLGGQDIKIK